MTSHFAQVGTFICGHPKSGTSLVAALLDAHPQLIVYPEETAYFRRFLPAARGSTVQEQLRLAETLLLHIFQWDPAAPPASQAGFPDRDYTAVDFKAVRTAFRQVIQETGISPSKILPAAIQAYGEVRGVFTERIERWVEKTPYNEEFARQIFHYWPEARCVHVVRDPRDNFASYHRKHPDWSARSFGYSWRRSLRRGEENRRRYGDHRYLMLRYEDLLTEPERELGRIADFLGIQFDVSMRQPTRAGVPWAGNSMYGDAFLGLSTKPIGRYVESLERNVIKRLEAVLHPEMTRWRYPLAFALEPGDILVRVLARLRWAGHDLARLRSAPVIEDLDEFSG